LGTVISYQGQLTAGLNHYCLPNKGLLWNFRARKDFLGLLTFRKFRLSFVRLVQFA